MVFPSVQAVTLYTKPGGKTLYAKLPKKEGFDNPFSERMRVGDSDRVSFFVPVASFDVEPTEAVDDDAVDEAFEGENSGE